MPAAPRQKSPDTAAPRRPWYLDALSAIAFFLVALDLLRPVKSLFGPIGALFFFIICGGLGWIHARAAWRELLERRS